MRRTIARILKWTLVAAFAVNAVALCVYAWNYHPAVGGPLTAAFLMLGLMGLDVLEG